MRKTVFRATLSASLIASTIASNANAGPREQALRLFDRLAGVPLQLSDSRLADMEAAIRAGNFDAAAQIATADDNFYNITVRHMATPLSSRGEDQLTPLNDLVATYIGAVRDERDAREFLTGNYIYKADPAKVTANVNVNGTQVSIHDDRAVYLNNQHYSYLETNRVNLRQTLVQAPQKAYTVTNNGQNATPANLADAAGLLTTRTWAQEHLVAGTNRRALQFAFQAFLCTPLINLREQQSPDNRVRRDVDRQPAGDANQFQVNCRTCHAGMDGLAGAFAFFDNAVNNGNNWLVYTNNTVRPKFNQNNNVYADGFQTTNSSWTNYWIANNPQVGWAPGTPTMGSGLASLGQSLANTRAFASCMAKTAFIEVCRRQPRDSEASLLSSLTDDFISHGYKMKRLIEKAAVVPACLGE